jgi:hypothetical protein
MAWTYRLTPAIQPTIYSYLAYTELLDTMDAKWIADDATGPAFIVRKNTRIALDRRFPLWDPPRTQLEKACNEVTTGRVVYALRAISTLQIRIMGTQRTGSY